MTRNKQLLSDKENERMFADMVENVVKKRVDLRYTSKPIAKVESFGEYHAIMNIFIIRLLKLHIILK